MEDKKIAKFNLEAKSLLTQLKITIPDIANEKKAQDALESLKEIFSKLGEIAGIYGINSFIGISNKLIQLADGAVKSKLTVDNNIIDFIGEVGQVLEKLMDDPMLKSSGLKKEFDNIHAEADQINQHNGSKKNIDATQTPIDKFQEVFVEEAFDLINQLEEKMLQLETDLQDNAMIDQVFRIMHTLKGNSNMFGYAYLGEITHELENIYDQIRAKKLEMSRSILQNTLNCIDHFRDLIEDPDLSNPAVKERQIQIKRDFAELLSADENTSAITYDEVHSTSGALHTFYIYFNAGPDVLDNGTNPLYFMYDLHDMGECLLLPVISSVCRTPDFNPEKCYTVWQIILVTEQNETDIREHFMFLQEESQPQVQILGAGNLLANKKFVDYFMSIARDNSGQVKIDPEVYEKGYQTQNMGKSLSGAYSGTKESIASVRVASQKIDQMMNLISELVTKQAELTMLAGSQDNHRLTEVAESIENISRDLRDNAFSISLIPLEKSVLRFQRLVRDVSNRFDKLVDFVVEGKETELDKTIIEKIVDPIMHILRNSIDHGIETPEVRKLKGKPETGTIKLKAYPSGAHVVIEIADDGAGINLDKVKTTAINKGLLSGAESINRDELLHLIVSPGFSTAENISEVSGRGVGMDVVNQKISEIRGELEISTEEDKGTVISIRLPLTISIIDSLLLKCAGDYYLVPLTVVDRCAEVRASDVLQAENNYVVLSDEYIPFVDLRNEFSQEEGRPDVQQILLVKHKDKLVGLVVDEVIGNYQAVLKSLGSAFKKQEIISGASILGSGEIALVLDTNKIIQEYTIRNELKVNAMS